MRLVDLRSVALLSFLTVAACEKKPEVAPDTGAIKTSPANDGAATTTTPDASTESAAATSDAGAKHEMGNCPTSVTGAEVAVKDVEGGIEVTVTGKDDATTKEIRERTKRLAEADKKDGGGGGRHDHSGAGGGATGRCTIVMRGTKLATAEIPNGAKVTVTAKDKAEIDWLRRETKERAKEAKTAAAEGAGAQRMANCPSAVEGAKTTVKDSKDGVVVTVTGDKVDEIRARAKHAAGVAKLGPDAGKVEHSGTGTGGGGLGRCPVIVEGDTTVAVKEVTGGVEVELTTKKDVAALQKEARARAANFPSK